MTEQNTGMEQGFEHEAKVVQDKKFRTSALMTLCQERRIKPRSLTREKLIEMGVAPSKMHLVMPIVAEKILEFYGLQAWEMRNQKRVSESGVTPEHYQFITTNLSIEGCYGKFLRSNIGDRVDAQGKTTQYEAMEKEFASPDSASQKVVIVDQEQIDETLTGRFENDIKRMKSELEKIVATPGELSPQQTKRKEELEKSIDILSSKLQNLNEDGTSTDGTTE